MNVKEIENKLQGIIDNFSKEEFIYDLLLAYGISKTSVTRLKKGDFNLSKNKNEILYKKKIFFKVEEADKLLDTVDTLSKDESILKQQPRFMIATDYKHIVAKDLKIGKNLDIEIDELPKYFDFFLPLAGSEVYKASNDNKADRDAAYKMAMLYDLLREENPDIYNCKEAIHNLNIFLSRLLFCYFAEDTEIFEEESIFTNTLVQHTDDNGSDTHEFLNRLFERLNSKESDGFASYLTKFPYVNGGLFKDNIDTPIFSSKARKVLIELGDLNWKEINPDIFGSMIQAVVIDEYRSDLGMHYTSVPNIKKLIKPLFLDKLYEEFEKSKDSVKKLRELNIRMSKMKFFDPACGSGNFLIITYKEIRLLEIMILQQIIELEQSGFMVFSAISLEQFYGIEIDDFAHEVAILSLWLAEHQMNQYFEEQLEGYTDHQSIIPLKKSGTIIPGNATRINWNDVCPTIEKDEVYIIGNPPYLGYSRQDNEQKKDMEITFTGIKNYKKLDYIACWFYKATKYIENANAKYAFVTTNSISQGEHISLLWPLIFERNQEVFFAYQSFKWTNNAKGNAGVVVAIIGIRNNENANKFLYQQNIKQNVKNISPYLTNTQNIIISPQSKPLSDLPKMLKGSSPSDDGNLLLLEDEKNSLINDDIRIEKFIKKYIGAQEFIKGTQRYCIFVTEETLKEAYLIEKLVERFNKVKSFRLQSKKEATQKKAEIPHSFAELRYQNTDSILIPRHTSENRDYIPIGLFNADTVITDSAMAIYKAEPWVFTLVTSRMHMVWVRAVGGKLGTGFRYSNTLCYNTFPFPEITIKDKENLNLYAFSILEARAKYSSKTIEWLYNPNTMPNDLKQAHQDLDEAVDKCYRLKPFSNDTERLEFLFKTYEEMNNR